MRVLMTAATLAIAVFGATAAVGAPPSAPAVGEKFGNWTIVQSTDSLTDKTTVSAIAPAGKDDAIVVACFSTEDTDFRTLTFVHRPYLGDTGPRRGFIYRLDDKPAVTVLAAYYDTTAVINAPGDYLPLLAGLRSSKRLRIRMTDASGADVNVDFDLAGVDQALARMDKVCMGPWKAS